MLAQSGATFAAVHSVVGQFNKCSFGMLIAVVVVAAVTLGGCTRPAVSPAGADPADPGAKIAGVGYHSTVAPYTSLRPTAPSSWREQNERVAPAPKSGR